ncbi:MAG TPA: hypothetical protein PKA37_10950, partial [Planctomycetota bacterium]|nr:hypothetical protein [Planctomycetota bacterium]
ASLSMGAPVAGDRVGGQGGASVFFVDGWAAAHPAAGARNGDLPRLYDGEAAQNHDDTRRTSWFDGERARLMVRLADACEVARINIYTWHRGNRAPQVYRLYGHASAAAGGMEEDLSASGWVAIADVDTRPLGMGGRHGVCIHNPKRILGKYARLLLDLRPAAGSEGPFLTEIDVFAKGDSLPLLKPPAFTEAEEPSVRLMLVSEDESLRLATEPAEGSVPMTVLRIPPGQGTLRFQMAVDRGLSPVEKVLEALPSPETLSALLRGGESLYKESITTEASVELAKGAAYVVDDIPIPFDNPYESQMRIGAFDFFADGDRAALCTWNGDVWVVSGLRAMKSIRWKRFATGLFETLGLKIVEDLVYVNGKDQITVLHDLNADGEADHYRCFNNDVHITDNFHEFTFDLQTDAEGNFYFSKAAPVLPGGRGFGPIVESHGTVMKLSRDGKDLRVFARGLRAPNGIGVGPNGEVTSGDNEGTWVPHCKLHWMREGSFQGVVDVAEKGTRPTSYNPPLCWFPMEVDNSGGGQVWVTSDSFGPFEGDLLHLSYGQSSIYKVMMQESGGFMQGAVFRLPVRLASSAMRARFHPLDGQLWVSGLKGWQTNAAKLAGFQRVRYTGETFASPRGFEVVEGGLKLTFTVPLDEELATDVESYEISHWNYVWGPQYGSPEVSADEPDEEVLKKALSSEMHRYQKRDAVPVESATLSADGRTVHLKIPTLKPVMQIRVKLDLESVDSKPMAFDIYGTIHHVPGQN